jgi:hypothetical protein
MGMAVGDYNGDGLLDLLKTHFADDIPALYKNLGKGLFEDAASAAGLAVQNRHVEWGAGMPDLDNDGRPDLLYVTGNVYPEVEAVLPQYPQRGPRVVFRNRDGSRFDDMTLRSGPGPVALHSSRGAAFGDFDNDGDLDVLVFNMNEPPSLLRNDYTGPNHWIAVKLEGTASNRSAIGATVRLTAGGRTQAQAVLSQSSYYSHDDLRLHFGLGAAAAADTIEVRWPNGGPSAERRPRRPGRRDQRGQASRECPRGLGQRRRQSPFGAGELRASFLQTRFRQAGPLFCSNHSRAAGARSGRMISRRTWHSRPR